MESHSTGPPYMSHTKNQHFFIDIPKFPSSAVPIRGSGIFSSENYEDGYF